MCDSFATPGTVAHQTPWFRLLFPGKNSGVSYHFLLPPSQPREWACISCIVGFFTTAPLGKSIPHLVFSNYITWPWNSYLTSFCITSSSVIWGNNSTDFIDSLGKFKVIDSRRVWHLNPKKMVAIIIKSLIHACKNYLLRIFCTEINYIMGK